ncbi:Ionotropic receptor 675 [Blattella germanica]|nr:Ionotropic receptor 675 [Blattella germanica]
MYIMTPRDRKLYYVLVIIIELLKVNGLAIYPEEDRQLLNCIETILKEHLSLNDAILVSSKELFHNSQNNSRRSLLGPIELPHISQQFLKNIYKDNAIYKHMSDIFIGEPEYDIQFHKTSACVIFLSSEERDEDTVRLLQSRMIDLVFRYSFWNSRAKHIIILDGNSKENKTELVHCLLKMLLDEYMVFDTTFIIRYVNPKASPINFLDIYTWFPFDLKSHIPILFNQWVLEGDGHFLREVNLFPSKLPKDFKGYKLEVLFTISETMYLNNGMNASFDYYTYDDISGGEIEVIKLISECTNIDFRFIHPQSENIPFFDRYKTTILNFALGKGDLYMSMATSMKDALLWSDMTFPHVVTGSKVYIPCPKPNPRLESISKIFDISVWLFVSTTYVLVTTTLWLIGRSTKNYHTIETSFNTLGMCSYNTFSLSLGMSAMEMPRTFKLRIIFLSFIWYSFSVSLIFQTFFTSILVDPGKGKLFTDLDDILDSGIEFGSLANLDYLYYRDEDDPRAKYMEKHRKDCHRFEVCLQQVVHDRNFVQIVYDYWARRYTATHLTQDKKSLCSLDGFYSLLFISLYLRKNSPFLEIFDRLIMLINASGFIAKHFQDEEHNWRLIGMKNTKSLEKVQPNDNYFVFNFTHLELAFLCLFIGFVVSAVSFSIELVMKRKSIVQK